MKNKKKIDKAALPIERIFGVVVDIFNSVFWHDAYGSVSIASIF